MYTKINAYISNINIYENPIIPFNRQKITARLVSDRNPFWVPFKNFA